MKKIFIVCIKKLLPLAFAALLLGCELVAATFEAGVGLIEAGAELGEAIGDAARDSAYQNEQARTLKEFDAQRKDNPINSPVESRLTRRTSTLIGGTPVDVSPYLLHNSSIAVTEKGIQQSGAAVKVSGLSKDLYELDVILAFIADNKNYQMNVTAVTNSYYLYDYVKQSLRQYAAERVGAKPETLQNFTVKLVERRKGKSDNRFKFDNVFIQDTEICYYQFDVEVEYQKQYAEANKRQPANFATLNKVYRSDLASAAGATLEVQTAIWEDVRKSGYEKAPLPIINVVKAVKVAEAKAAKIDRLKASRTAKEKAIILVQGNNKTAEERLTRRTSTLAEGTPVDISPYLVHESSFAVFENEVQYNRTNIIQPKYDSQELFEFDLAVTFEIDKTSYKLNKTAALSAYISAKNSDIKKNTKNKVKLEIAKQFGVEPKKIKKFNVKFLKTRKANTEVGIVFSVNDTEPCYYQFDVEAEYLIQEEIKRKKQPVSFTTVNKVYRSDFTSEEAATLDVQYKIKKDVPKYSTDVPPIINFVKAVKVKL